MITFNELLEMWPGTKDYEAKYGKPRGFTGGDTERRGNRHDITTKGNVTRAIRRVDDTGDTAEPDKKVEIQDGPKRGRGRPPGKYGAYKKRVKESLEIIESLETNEEIEDFLRSLDEESYTKLVEYFNSIEEDTDQLDELSKDTLKSYYGKAGADRHDKKKALDIAKRVGDTKTANQLKDKIHARSDGIEKVKNRFAEDTEISESLSVDSLAAFISKNRE